MPANPSAFPICVLDNWKEINRGMNLLDYFAANAIVGLLSNATFTSNAADSVESTSELHSKLVRHAFSIARHALAERENST